MTKNVPAKAGGKNLPTTWEARLASMAKESVQQEASVSTGQFISTRAGQLSYNGNPVQGNKLDAIVVDAILENCYYKGDFDPDNPAPPVCYAFGRDDKDMHPHEQSPEPQAKSCAECELNEFGTADRGKGKACKNIRRLALLPAQPLDAEALEKAEIAYLKTPVTSVKGWAAYVRTLDALRKRPPIGVVTEISTVADPKSQYKVLFNHKLDLPAAPLEAVFARLEEVKSGIAFPYAPPSTEAPGAKKTPAKKRKY